MEKCCNKFKKPSGNPGDPKRDMMGVDSGGDEGLSVSDDEK